MPECTSYASNMHMHIHIMHIWAYPSMSAQMCILVRAIPTQIWMNIGYCMIILCQICIRMNIWKKPNSTYDYMHIRVYSSSYLNFLIYLGNTSHDLSFYFNIIILFHVKFLFLLYVFTFWITCCNFCFN